MQDKIFDKFLESVTKWFERWLTPYLKHYKKENQLLIISAIICLIQAYEIRSFPISDDVSLLSFLPQPNYSAWIQYPILWISAAYAMVIFGILLVKIFKSLGYSVKKLGKSLFTIRIIRDKHKKSKQKMLGASVLLLGCVFIVFFALYGLRWFELRVTSTSIEKIRESSEFALKNNQNERAIRLLYNSHKALAPNDSTQFDILTKLSTAYLESQLYQESIKSGCDAISVKKPEKPIKTLGVSIGNSENQSGSEDLEKFTVRLLGSIAHRNIAQSIYNLAHTSTLTDTLALIQTFRINYNGDCDNALSVFWTAIAPDVFELLYFEPFQTEYGNILKEDDRQNLLSLIQIYPNETSRDIAFYILEDYFKIIVSYPQSKIIELARYAYGLQLFNKSEYDDAIEQFERYASAYPNDVAHADSLWRIAKAYVHKGDYQTAIKYLLQAIYDTNDPDGILIDCPECDLFYLLDRVPEDQLHRLKRLKPDFELILGYAVAFRALIKGNYVESKELFQNVVEKSEYKFGDAAKKIKQIDMLLALLDESSLYIRIQNEADFLIENPFFLWADSEINASRISIEDSIYGQWYLEHSTRYKAANLLEKLLQIKRTSITEELKIRKQVAELYRQSAADELLEDANIIEMLRQSSLKQYKFVLEHTPENSIEFDKLFEIIGMIYLDRASSIPDGWVAKSNLRDVQSMRREYLGLVQKYPKHHLANNALNWVAWSYCLEANVHLDDPQIYTHNYLEALNYYKLIRDKYPLGLTRTNAIDNITIIEEKLKNVSERKLPDESVWGWYP